MLVGTPIPETDDRCTKEYDIARELWIHRIGGIGVEHVGCSEAVVGSVADTHHFRPSCRDAAVAEHIQAKEQHEERTDNKNRCLNGRQSHHTLHSTKDSKDGGNGNQSDGTIPEWDAKQEFEEDTTGEGSHGNFR